MTAEANWLSSELDRAKHEVQSWDAWKRDAMRREATAISLAPETANSNISVSDDSTNPGHGENPQF